ncbi:MAG: hypothetical protein ACTTKS_02320 [Bulleidia sp.]
MHFDSTVNLALIVTLATIFGNSIANLIQGHYSAKVKKLELDAKTKQEVALHRQKLFETAIVSLQSFSPLYSADPFESCKVLLTVYPFISSENAKLIEKLFSKSLSKEDQGKIAVTLMREFRKKLEEIQI